MRQFAILSFLILLGLTISLPMACGSKGPSSGYSKATKTATSTRTVSSTFTPTSTGTDSATPTQTPTITQTSTGTPTLTSTTTPTATNTAWATPVETNGWSTGYQVGGILVSGSSLYVGDYSNNLVKKYSLGGTLDGSWVAPSVQKPVGLLLDGSGNLYVGGNAVDTIKVFNAQATPIATIGPASHYLSMTDNGPSTIIASDFDNQVIDFFNPAGSLLNSWSVTSLNWGVKRDGSLLYVVDYLNPVLKLFNLDGSSAGASWTTTGNERVVAVDSNHKVYVAGNGVVSRYSSTGVLETTWGSYNTLGLDVDSSNNLYVGDINSGGAIHVFAP